MYETQKIVNVNFCAEKSDFSSIFKYAGSAVHVIGVKEVNGMRIRDKFLHLRVARGRFSLMHLLLENVQK